MGEHINSVPDEVLIQMRNQVAAECSDGVERLQVSEMRAPSGEAVGITADCENMLEVLDAQIIANAAVNASTGANE